MDPKKCFILTCNYPFATLEKCWYASRLDISNNEKIDPKQPKAYLIVLVVRGHKNVWYTKTIVNFDEIL